MAELIERTERGLGAPFPGWLREVYLSCNGFTGPIGVCDLFGLWEREQERADRRAGEDQDLD